MLDVLLVCGWFWQAYSSLSAEFEISHAIVLGSTEIKFVKYTQRRTKTHITGTKFINDESQQKFSRKSKKPLEMVLK